ncbi:MAG: YoaK family protein [Sphaerochaetaceae bacterium]
MKHPTQMSEAFSTAIFLTLSGGFQDAYTYLTRNKVFANAQTGNIVLFSQNLAEGHWSSAVRYVVPLLSFILGVYGAEALRHHFQHVKRLHWRQLVLLIEIAILFSVGFIPQKLNPLANALVSFVCALQVQTFRKVKGNAYATTMCIGNLRSGTERLYTYHKTKDKAALFSATQYFGIIVLFALGAGLGGVLAERYHEQAIWASCLLLLISFLMMFIKEHEVNWPHLF